MVDTSFMNNVEAEVVKKHLPSEFGNKKFRSQHLLLKWGGKFSCDAASEDISIVGLISTSGPKTIGGKFATGSFHKIVKDIFMLLSLRDKPKTRFMVFTNKEMYEEIKKRQSNGLLPPEKEVKCLYVKLPQRLEEKVQEIRKQAAKEGRRK